MNHQNTLAVAAFVGLLSGLTSLSTPQLDLGQAATEPLGEKAGCKGKDGCSGKDGCKGKDGCSGKDGTGGKTS
jgi:hypothetical protein